MKVIVGVKFRKPGKVYFFDPGNLHVNIKNKVIVETALGEELGEVVAKKKILPDTKLNTPLKPIIRIANYKHIKHYNENKKKEEEAFKISEERIKKLNLEMHLTDVEYTFDNSKLLFYFTADGRIDFRELVKELAAIFKTRIELRQIGVRDEVKRIGGNGVCGTELCCCSFLNNFEAVSIKMAKEQNMSLNPSKISGTCGRLMCCLKYEQEVYEDKLSHLPKIGAIVNTDEGEGTVDSIETLKEIVKVKFKDDDGETYYKNFNASDLKIIQNNTSNEDVVDEEEKENMAELQKLEELEKQDRETETEDDIF